MTLSEFKAWFEGYTDGMDEKAPSEKQWKKIKAKVSEITGTPISYPVYVNRYVDPYRQYWTDVYFGARGSGMSLSGISNLTLQNAQANPAAAIASAGNTAINDFDSHAAMYAAGKAEFAA